MHTLWNSCYAANAGFGWKDGGCTAIGEIGRTTIRDSESESERRTHAHSGLTNYHLSNPVHAWINRTWTINTDKCFPIATIMIPACDSHHPCQPVPDIVRCRVGSHCVKFFCSFENTCARRMLPCIPACVTQGIPAVQSCCTHVILAFESLPHRAYIYISSCLELWNQFPSNFSVC